jgi:hypothetical protein
MSVSWKHEFSWSIMYVGQDVHFQPSSRRSLPEVEKRTNVWSSKISTFSSTRASERRKTEREKLRATGKEEGERTLLFLSVNTYGI